VPGRAGTVDLVECKAGRRMTPSVAAPMLRLAMAVSARRGHAAETKMFLVHQSLLAGTPRRLSRLACKRWCGGGSSWGCDRAAADRSRCPVVLNKGGHVKACKWSGSVDAHPQETTRLPPVIGID
jgi:hypothetical protein